MASLSKYSGPWNENLVAHLFRRASFGANLGMIKSYAQKSMDETLQLLFAELPMPSPPLNIDYDSDLFAPIGETWVDKLSNGTVIGYRKRSLNSWSMQQLSTDVPNIREKMTLFWHNHFVVADINDPRFTFQYITLLRSNALGNFKQLTKDITIDVAMLNYLNGRENSKQAPNENFARELMELFTLGKGDIAGPGDYTTFTEQDVKELAKALTGWVDERTTLPLRSTYRSFRHDTTTKTLSHRFGNKQIPDAGAEEYKNVIDIIFERDEVAYFIARKLYVWFVYSKIDEDIEQNIIAPMAKMIRDNDFEMRPVILALLSSDHFYESCVVGVIIKNPIEFLMGPANLFGINVLAEPITTRNLYNNLFNLSNNMQMGLFQAPSVAGWQAFYQEPNYYKLWLNASSLPSRMSYTNTIASTGINVSGYRYKIDYPTFLEQCAFPSNVDSVISDLSLLIFPKPLATNQIEVLKKLLDGTGNALKWAVLYTNYLANPQGETQKTAIYNRIRVVVAYMFVMPESHLN